MLVQPNYAGAFVYLSQKNRRKTKTGLDKYGKGLFDFQKKMDSTPPDIYSKKNIIDLVLIITLDKSNYFQKSIRMQKIQKSRFFFNSRNPISIQVRKHGKGKHLF